jgi:hypothetical protein
MPATPWEVPWEVVLNESVDAPDAERERAAGCVTEWWLPTCRGNRQECPSASDIIALRGFDCRRVLSDLFGRLSATARRFVFAVTGVAPMPTNAVSIGSVIAVFKALRGLGHRTCCSLHLLEDLHTRTSWSYECLKWRGVRILMLAVARDD